MSVSNVSFQSSTNVSTDSTGYRGRNFRRQPNHGNAIQKARIELIQLLNTKYPNGVKFSELNAAFVEIKKNSNTYMEALKKKATLLSKNSKSAEALCMAARCLFPEMQVALGKVVHFPNDVNNNNRLKRYRAALRKFKQVIIITPCEVNQPRTMVKRTNSKSTVASSSSSKSNNSTKMVDSTQSALSYAYFGLALLNLPEYLNRPYEFEHYAKMWLRRCGHVTLPTNDSALIAQMLATKLYNNHLQLINKQLSSSITSTAQMKIIRRQIRELDDILLVETFANHQKADRMRKTRQVCGRYRRIKKEIGSKLITETIFDSWQLREPKKNNTKQEKSTNGEQQQQQQNTQNEQMANGKNLFDVVELTNDGNLVARININSGHVLFREPMLAFKSSNNSQVLCSNCYRKPQSQLSRVSCFNCNRAYFCNRECLDEAISSGRHRSGCHREPISKVVSLAFSLLQTSASTDEVAALFDAIRQKHWIGENGANSDQSSQVKLDLLVDVLQLLWCMGFVDDDDIHKKNISHDKISQLYQVLHVVSTCPQTYVPLISGGFGRKVVYGYGMGSLGSFFGSGRTNVVQRFDENRGLIEYITKSKINAGNFLILGYSKHSSQHQQQHNPASIMVNGPNAKNWIRQLQIQTCK